jgi:hypothetical protein
MVCMTPRDCEGGQSPLVSTSYQVRGTGMELPGYCGTDCNTYMGHE